MPHCVLLVLVLLHEKSSRILSIFMGVYAHVTVMSYRQGGSGLKNIFDGLIFFLAVRTKVKEILELLTNDERLREERKKARKLKDKYVGVSGGGFGEYFVNTEMV